MTSEGPAPERPPPLQRLKKRKIVQWSLAYLAAAWLVIQVLDIVGERFGWPNALLQALIVLVGFGFFLTPWENASIFAALGHT